jgi:hypothetical protein
MNGVDSMALQSGAALHYSFNLLILKHFRRDQIVND